MRSLVAAVVAFGGIIAASGASAQTPPANSDLYHVHFTKAAPGQAAALGKALVVPDKTSPMPSTSSCCAIRKATIGTTP